MKKAKKAVFPVRKIIGICLILLLMMGVGVTASNTKARNIKIILSNGYEMNIVTTKTKVADILEENHIILLPEENVVPNKEKEISDNNTIRITKIADSSVEEETVATAENSESMTSENILESYDSIVEKIEVAQEVIPYETITKDVSDGSSTKKDTVIQEGKDGLKEVTYKIKYQNDVQIEKTEVSSNIIQEPVDKIIEVRKQATTSRSPTVSRTATSYNNGVWDYSDSELDLICAITAQESSSGYEGSLAVITCACNRAERDGSDPLSEYKAKGQFCYTIDGAWKKRLNGNYASYVETAVSDALNGKRNHTYTSFRAAGYANGEYIGGNVYF